MPRGLKMAATAVLDFERILIFWNLKMNILMYMQNFDLTSYVFLEIGLRLLVKI